MPASLGKVLLVSCMLLNCSDISAREYPSIKGVRLDESREEFIANNPMLSRCSSGDYCRYEDTIGGVFSEFLVTFKNDRIVMLGVSDIDANRFDEAVAALVSKFGKPSIAQSNTVGNAMGARFENRTLTWGSEKQGWWLQAQKRTTEDIFKSMIAFTTAANQREFDQASKRKKDDI